jgi:hypothetical protein
MMLLSVVQMKSVTKSNVAMKLTLVLLTSAQMACSSQEPQRESVVRKSVATLIAVRNQPHAMHSRAQQTP